MARKKLETKESQESQKPKENIEIIENNIITSETITVEETNTVVPPAKSKRGRKPKNASLNSITTTTQNMQHSEHIENNENIILSHAVEINELSPNKDNETSLDNEDDVDENDQPIKPHGKKRGRKPKGGKIIQQIITSSSIKETKPNVILHLKCYLKDLHNQFNGSNDNDINGYNFSSCKKELLYEIISNNNYEPKNTLKMQNEDFLKQDSCETDSCDNDSYVCNKKNDMKDLWKKLKNLEYSLHLNNISDKKSACFWCTYEFDNPPIYIPKHYIKDSYHVYGCFCSPECAAAFLMEESIDSSTKFERYHLLNHIYSKIYDYTKNIKPAPKPHYMLEKFYGNLNIQEYRSLLKNDRLFLVVDKPLTRILPELHEDNDDFIINNKIIPSNTYQIKKKLNKQTKHTILTEKFGLGNNS